MEKTKVWSVPESYELDKDQSTDKKVVLKKIDDKRVDSWQEYCKLMKGKDSCFVDMNGNVRTTNFLSTAAVGEFEDMEDAMAFAALHKLISLRKNWVGDWKPDWTNEEQDKYAVYAKLNELTYGVRNIVSAPLSFPTYQMCIEFLDTFKDILEIAKPLL